MRSATTMFSPIVRSTTAPDTRPNCVLKLNAIEIGILSGTQLRLSCRQAYCREWCSLGSGGHVRGAVKEGVGCAVITAVPGRPLTATDTGITTGKVRPFKSARELSARLALVSGQRILTVFMPV